MTKFDNLIQELCPDGVRYKSLGEVGLFFRRSNRKKQGGLC